jgi:propanol-preferring alcohol dehydrogenase
VGTVDALGIDATRFRLGERVGIAWLRHTCGACVFCRTGAENLCPGSRYTGWDADGGYAEAAVVPEAFAYRIPGVFGDLEATPLLCAGIIGYRALRRSRIRPGGRLGLYGFGSSAHIALQVARHWGCEVYVCTRGEEARRLAEKLGAAWVGEAKEQPPAPLDAAVLFAPAGDLVPPALRALRPGATLACAGIYMSDIPTIRYTEELFQERVLTSVTANTRQDGEELLAVAAEIPVRLETTLFPLEEANEALLRLKEGSFAGSGVLLVRG